MAAICRNVRRTQLASVFLLLFFLLLLLFYEVLTIGLELVFRLRKLRTKGKVHLKSIQA